MRSDRLAALQQAFLAVFKDPAFASEAQPTQLDVDPKSGVQVLQVVNEILATPQDVRRTWPRRSAPGSSPGAGLPVRPGRTGSPVAHPACLNSHASYTALDTAERS
jgi:hypothetical protein